MNELRIRALGGLDVEVDGRPLPTPVPAKGRALLAYLAMAGGRADRSRLAGLLLSDLSEAAARQNLRLALTRMRRAVDYVQADRAAVWLTGAWSADAVDAEAFAADASVVNPDTVLDVVRREFLDGFDVPGANVFGEWVTATRAQLRTVALGAARRRGRSRVDRRGRVDSGDRGAARRMLELEPADEAAHRASMRLFAAAGQPSAALAQFDTCMHGCTGSSANAPASRPLYWPTQSAAARPLRPRRRPTRGPSATVTGGRRRSCPSRVSTQSTTLASTTRSSRRLRPA